MNKALLIIDYVYCCVFPLEYQGLNYKTDKIKNLYKKIQKLLDYARRNNYLVVWVVPKLVAKNKLPGNLIGVIDRRTTKGTTHQPNVIYKLKPLKTERIFEKIYYSAFSGTDGRLDGYLKGKGVDTLLISGIYSTTCVDATITEAFGRGYKLEIYKNCVETIETPFSQRFQKDLIVHWKYKYGKIMEI